MNQLIKTFDKLLNQVYKRTESDLEKHNRTQRKIIRSSLQHYRSIAKLILDDAIPNAVSDLDISRSWGRKNFQ